MARQLILGTAGHIDHGKTALVRALTGVDTDRLPQEKQRGITIDIGFALLDLGDCRLGVVDVPGHERFIKNMLAGASGVDLALLVVAADDSVMPQTREHLAILRLLGVERGVIALTKCDLSDADWLDLVEHDVRELVAGTGLESAPIVRTSARDGAGLDELKACLRDVAATAPTRPADAPFRLSIDRSFVSPGLGTVVTGVVRSGEVRAGDEVEFLPRKSLVKVRGIQSHGESLSSIGPGRRAALNLPGVHHTDVARGDELAAPGVFEPSVRLAGRLQALKDIPWPIKHRSRVRLHIGAGEVIAGVRLLDRDRLSPGESCIVELACAAPVVAMAGQAFVVRAESPLVTLGGGRILQTHSRIRRRDPATWRSLDSLDLGDDVTRASAALEAAGERVLSATALWQLCGLWGDRAASALVDMTSQGLLVELGGGRFVHTAPLEATRKRIKLVMKRLHDASPMDTHIERTRLTQTLSFVDQSLLDAAIESMKASGALHERSGALALPGRGPSFTEAQLRLRDAWLKGAKASPFSPPGPGEIAGVVGASDDEARKMARACVKLGELVHLGDDIYLHVDAERQLIERVSEAMRREGGQTVSQIKSLLETSRKFAVPICEHLDKLGVTKRKGDLRVLAEESVRT